MTPNTHSASIEYATKADLDQLRTELKADMRELRLELQADMRVLRMEFKADLAEQMRGVESSINKTIITTLIAMTAIFGGLVTVLKLFV